MTKERESHQQKEMTGTIKEMKQMIVKQNQDIGDMKEQMEAMMTLLKRVARQ